MIYNLIKKEEANNYKLAKEKVIESITLDKNRVNKDYKIAFPRIYDENIHFVYEGQLRPFKINADYSLYFYTDKECAINGYRELRTGEQIINGALVFTESPSEEYRWSGNEWLEPRAYEIYTGAITLESEKNKARIQREKEFLAYHKLINNYAAGVVDIDQLTSYALVIWRAEWLDIPNNYNSLDIPIENSYPIMHERVAYYYNQYRREL